MSFDIEWIDSGREPQCLPDPAYPTGKDECKPLGKTASPEVK